MTASDNGCHSCPETSRRCFHIVNLGCKVNRVESDEAAIAFSSAGLVEGGIGESDVLLVNTCTVTGEAEKKARKAVHRCLRENDHAIVIVTGCASAVHPEAFLAMSSRVEVVPKIDLSEYLRHMFPPRDGAHLLRTGEGFPTRVGMKIQDGCRHACTYCIVHVARGVPWSRPMDEVVREARAYAENGVREIVLTGIDLGSYESGGAHLAQLLGSLLEATSSFDVRFRISSIEPKNVTEELIDLMASSEGRVCRHLHVPLQSGSGQILRRMARPYSAEYFRDLCAGIRRTMPMASLSTDIIVGFPGETEEDFLLTCAMAHDCGFSRIHVFRYSRREGTPAAGWPDQVPAVVKAERSMRLSSLADTLSRADLANRRGSTEMALVEDDGMATTESYHSVIAPAGSRKGDLVRMVL